MWESNPKLDHCLHDGFYFRLTSNRLCHLQPLALPPPLEISLPFAKTPSDTTISPVFSVSWRCKLLSVTSSSPPL